jgi:hypothetical protein
LRSVTDVEAPDGEPDLVARVVGARLVFASHELLAHDLPALSDAALSGSDPIETRERWLIGHAGVISLTQAAQTVVNTRVLVARESREAWRPPRYGRAVVVCAGARGNSSAEESSLLLDLKGAGIGPGRRPALEPHASGLCSLREALREALFEAIIGAIFARAAPDFWTLPIYGVIDLGFDVKTHRGEILPAGLLVRRAHRRSEDGIVLPCRGSAKERLRLEVELLLRCYGLTGSNPGTRIRLAPGPAGPRVAYGVGAFEELDPTVEPAAIRAASGMSAPVLCDGLNVQLTWPPVTPAIRAQLVDFGHYEVRRSFDRPLVSLVCDAPHRWGATLFPTDRQFVRPHPFLCRGLERWAREREAAELGAAPRAAVDPPTRWADRAARDFRAGEIGGKEIVAAIARAAQEAVGEYGKDPDEAGPGCA